MNVLLVFAHPEPRSLNGALKDFALQRLRAQGHQVEVSDLYAMGWKAVLDGADFPARDAHAPLDTVGDSLQAYQSGTLTADVLAEHAKLRRADVLILQFPLWWFSLPAILKGWIDRVWACGFAYGVGEHSATHWGDRYGEGTFRGKRAMLMVTAGGWESHYAARGVNGPIDDILFPIQHGMLYYPGFAVLSPFVVYHTSRLDAARFAQTTATLGARLDALASTPPIPFRPQNGGDYTIPALALREDLAAGRSGFGVHVEG
jgi:NAD(P)H dehydrogenase (quinone)